MKAFDAVILIETLPRESIFDDARGQGLQAGAFGYIVDTLGQGEAFNVEFFDDGETIAIAEVRANQLRAATEADLAERRLSA